MLGLTFSDSRVLKVLCLGAHCDDIEIGCGGTILGLTKARSVECTWVVFCSTEVRAKESENCAAEFLGSAISRDVRIHGFRDGFLPYVGYEVKEKFEELKAQVSPDVIFTHYRHDKHQDHRILSELTLNTFRDHLILEYEIPKYDGDIGQPNTYFPVCSDDVFSKVSIIDKHYKSQKKKNWFTSDLFKSLMRIRGMEINAAEQHAEAFYCYKHSIKL